MNKKVCTPFVALTLSLLTRAQAICLSNEFTCSNGDCIPAIFQCDRYNHCGDNSDEVKCVCYTGEIRLLGGPTAAQGTVELCAKNKSDSICGQSWTTNDAKVICQQLGYNASNPVYNSYYGSGSSSTFWVNVAGGCVGNESRLLSCSRGPITTCTSRQLAGVQCSAPYCPSPNFQCANTHCVNHNWRCDGHDDCKDNSDEYDCLCHRGDIQLVGGAFPTEGTVEVCNNNIWGTVCDTLWTSLDAMVVCNQLGYTSASAPFYDSFFGQGMAENRWSDVGGCRGSENSIASCHFTTPVDCNSSNFAGARCFGISSSQVSASTVGGVAAGGAAFIIIGCIFIIVRLYCKRPRRRAPGVVPMLSLHPPPVAQIQSTTAAPENANNVNPKPYSALSPSLPPTDEEKFMDPDTGCTLPPQSYDLCVIENRNAFEKL